MARNCEDDAKWQDSTSDQEDETLSLCDLALDYTDDEEKQLSRNQEAEEIDQEPDRKSEEEEDFDFGSWGGSVLTEKEMCAADEVFFKGQILPFSSNPCRSESQSESMDRSSSTGLTSISSRSSSINSTTSSATSTSKKTYNQFHAHPSPKPQLRVSGCSNRGSSNRSRKSSLWDFFRLGLVPTPEIELQDLKIRRGAKTGNGAIKKSKSKNLDVNVVQDTNKAMKRDRFLDKNYGFLRGCKCSVETVPWNINVTVKNKSTTLTKSSTKKSNSTESARRAMQQQELKKTTKQRSQGNKHAVSRHRTFEWLKELSHASSPDHETTALLA